MKQGKKPTRAQKAVLTANNLNAENWLIERVGDGYLMAQHRLTGSLRKVPTPKQIEEEFRGALREIIEEGMQTFNEIIGG